MLQIRGLDTSTRGKASEMSLAHHWISVTTLDGVSVVKAPKPVPYLHSKQREENEAGGAV